MNPTHVMVMAPYTCEICKGSGNVKENTPFGVIEGECWSCRGRTCRETWITLEDFAKLFSWGTAHGENEHGPTMKNVLRVVPQGGTGDGG